MKEALDTAKSWLDLSKSVGFIGVIAVVILSPGQIAAWMERAGVEKLGILGVEWQKKLKVTDEELQQLQAARKDMETRLNAAQELIGRQSRLLLDFKTLSSPPVSPPAGGGLGGGGAFHGSGRSAGSIVGRGGLGGSGGNVDSGPIRQPNSNETATRTNEIRRVDQLLEEAKTLVAENKSAIDKSRGTTAAAQRAILANSSLLQSDSPWLIMIGSDPSPEQAQDERKKASGQGFENVSIYKNRSRYRTALFYKSRQEAADAFGNVKANLADDAYMVSLDKFCPRGAGAKPDAASGFVDCGS